MHDTLNELSIYELEELISEAKALISERQEQRIQSSYIEIIRIASDLGLTVEELIHRGRGKTLKKQNRGVVTPKYRNPMNLNETWTSRGRQPRWVSENLSQGITLEDMLIK